MERPDLLGRCGTCVRFARVTEIVDQNGEVRRSGECLLNVWPSPIYETNTCSQWVQKGTLVPRPAPKPQRASPRRSAGFAGPQAPAARAPLVIPEELLDMNAEEFRSVLREVIRDELGVGEIAIADHLPGGEVILKPGKEGTQEKRFPIDSFFHKVVMVRDKLRVLEQKINAHPKLGDAEKVEMQSYITRIYGSLTSFNILFADEDDKFRGTGGDDQ